MANELQISVPIYTGQALYALRRSAAGQIWNGSAFVTYVTANYALYPITMTEQGAASGYFVGTDPSATTPGSVVVKVRSGGSPAETDADAGVGTILAAVNVQQINAVPLTGGGTGGNPMRPA